MDNYLSSTPLDETVTRMKTRSQTKSTDLATQGMNEGVFEKIIVSHEIDYDNTHDNNISSHTISPAESNPNEVDVQIKLAKAKLRQREIELQLRLFEAQKEVELAELEFNKFKLANKDSHPQEVRIPIDRDRTQTSSRDPITEIDVLKDSIHAIAGYSNLPRLEIGSFDGTPINYYRFINQFDNMIASRTTDASQLLAYLIHFCQGKAKRAIETCITLPAAIGYSRARTVLKDLYGQKHMIARAHIDELVRDNKPITNSSEDLTEFATLMRNNQMSLEQLGWESEMNFAPNLERVLSRLPIDIQIKWADLADEIIRAGREPRFNDLINLVETKARVARTRYGQLWRQNQGDRQTRFKTVNTRGDGNPRGETSHVAATHYNTVSRSNLCPICKLQHLLIECPQFLNASMPSRRDMTRQYGLCYICLRTGHNARYCRSNERCTHPGCGGKHHLLLHITEASSEQTARINLTRGVKGNIFFGTIPVRVSGPKGTTETYAFIDGGSDTSLVSEELLSRIGVSGRPTKLNIMTLSGVTQQLSQEIELELWSLDQSGSISLSKAYTLPRLPLERSKPTDEWNQNKWEHLRDVYIPELTNNVIEIVIGSDTPMAHWALEQRWGAGSQPFAIRSHLGWRILGPYSAQDNKHHVMWCGCTANSDIKEDYSKLFEHEFQDLEGHERGLSIEDQRALLLADQSYKLVEGHIEIAPPWKEERPAVDNLPLALGRLKCLRSRLKRDPNLWSRYNTQMINHISKGHIIRVCEGIEPGNINRWYIPHHPVINPKKPEKIRIVFDCAAKHRGRSLNDYLLQGPNTVNSLFGVLLRFRRGKIAIAADIEEMFLQVRLPSQDQRAFSLLWWEDGNINRGPATYQLTVHPFGAVSSPFCANYSLQRVLSLFGDKSKLIDKAVDDYFYVDDCLVSLDTTEEAQEFVRELSQTLLNGGFKLTKWVSNDSDVLASIQPELITPALRELGLDKTHVERTLGMMWDTSRDSFVYNNESCVGMETRRRILSVVASTFDPLGLISPFILPAKQILQRLCIMKLDWDDKIPAREKAKWETWRETMSEIHNIKIPRCYKDSELSIVRTTQFHVFCDASEEGYGAVIYIRYVDKDGRISCRLLTAKARVTPIKTQTIPRLELTAAMLGARMYDMVRAELRPREETVTFWTDSVIVLHYINNIDSRYQTFVANRLAVIHRLTRVNQWKYVPSEVNVADLVSRGLSQIDGRLKCWIQGPSFLMEEEHTWPEWKAYRVGTKEIEVKASCMVNTITECIGMHRLLGYYSDWFQLLKAVARYRRFSKYIQMTYGGRNDLTLRLGRMTLSEMEAAEKVIIQFVQRDCFQKEMRALCLLTEPIKNIKDLARLRGLNPVIMEDLLRVGGRLQNAGLTTTAHPVILPNKGHITELIMRYAHESQGHIGATQLLANVRQRYWVLQGGVAARRIVRKCIKCKMITPRPCDQIMAPLPRARVQAGGYPFTSVGTDFFGPFFVKRGRITEKRYGCIFTCMNIRAIHIEITHSMSADSFLMALMRLCGRRGYPREVYCDNGSNFVGAHNELTEAVSQWSQDTIYERLLRWKIEWKFNPPSASHRGGVWERMIRTIRKILGAIMQERVTTDECLMTCMIEVERIINDRPLTPITSDPNDLEALTPSHLLLLRSNPGGINVVDPGDPLVKRWKQVNHISHIFWKRWTKEYLPLLQERRKWQTENRNIQIDDLVIVLSEVNERGKWPLGRVTRTIEDTDHIVRTVDIKTAHSVIRRDIRSICLLEAVEDQSQQDVRMDLGSSGPESLVQPL